MHRAKIAGKGPEFILAVMNGNLTLLERAHPRGRILSSHLPFCFLQIFLKMLHVAGFTQSTITAIWRSNVVVIYSSISGSPRTVSMRFDPSEITQSQGLRHSLCFLFWDNENLKRGILPSVFSLQFIHRARPAEVPAAARHVSGQKSFFQICS